MPQDYINDFPALNQQRFSYLDSAATTQVPQCVLDAVCEYYQSGHANPYRGQYSWSDNAEDRYRECRVAIANVLSTTPNKLVFSKSATESINMVSYHFSNKIHHGQSICISVFEHHANFLPWQRLAQQTGTKIKILKLDSNGEIDLQAAQEVLNDNCALLAITQCSNVTGYEPPVRKLINLAKKSGVKTLVDGAQYLAHNSVNIQDLDPDFYVFSAHKRYSISGLGVLYIKSPEDFEPMLLGGGIVNQVTPFNYTLSSSIRRFEAGSPNMASIVAFNAALNYLEKVDWKAVNTHHAMLIETFKSQFIKLGLDQSMRLVSHPNSQAIISIYSQEFHSHDIAGVLANEQVAVRAGHHCAQPLLSALGLKHCVRISLGIYSTRQDIDRLLAGLLKIKNILG
ncbi:aminotransferase class V-fold PLP-dependent enzyme [Aliikangiella sp. IMCC44653]